MADSQREHLEASLPHAVFRRLCDALEIRSHGPADRDRRLYEEVRVALGMGMLTPKRFFLAHPNVTEMRVLVAFMDTMEPFARMLEQVFDVVSVAARGATGGHDLQLAYGPEAEDLRFDLRAFERYREVRQQAVIRGSRIVFHSDYVPAASHVLSTLANGRLSDQVPPHNPPMERDVVMDRLGALIARAGEAAAAHLEFLGPVLDGPARPSSPEAIQSWLDENGVGYDHSPRDARRLDSWRESMAKVAALAPNIDETALLAHSPETINSSLDRLERALDHIVKEVAVLGLVKALEMYLELPFWKKRWQLYEAWVAARAMNRFLRCGGRLCPDPCGRVVLRTGASSQPIAELEAVGRLALELWFEFPLGNGGPPLRPDLALVVRHVASRSPVAVLECKQRVEVSAQAMLADAAKYLPALPAGSRNLVVNYDPFEADAEVNVAGRCLLARGGVLPSTSGASALEAWLVEAISGNSVWVVLVDTTGSMRGRLDAVARDILARGNPGAPTLLVSYGDHEDDPTSTLVAEANTGEALALAVKDAPLTDGTDEPEALEDALAFALSAAAGRCVDQVRIYTDAPAHRPVECPAGHDFAAEVQNLIVQGATVTLVACGVSPERLGWIRLPGVAVEELNSDVP